MSRHKKRTPRKDRPLPIQTERAAKAADRDQGNR